MKACKSLLGSGGGWGHHSLPTILALATGAMLRGARSVYDIARSGGDQHPAALAMLGLTSKKLLRVATFRRTFGELDPTPIETAVSSWAELR
jgi:hypothetical protein